MTDSLKKLTIVMAISTLILGLSVIYSRAGEGDKNQMMGMTNMMGMMAKMNDMMASCDEMMDKIMTEEQDK